MIKGWLQWANLADPELSVRWRGKFDYVDCCGVLHHMAEPVEAWRALVQTLAPSGLMKAKQPDQNLTLTAHTRCFGLCMTTSCLCTADSVAFGSPKFLRSSLIQITGGCRLAYIVQVLDVVSKRPGSIWECSVSVVLFRVYLSCEFTGSSYSN